MLSFGRCLTFSYRDELDCIVPHFILFLFLKSELKTCIFESRLFLWLSGIIILQLSAYQHVEIMDHIAISYKKG